MACLPASISSFPQAPFRDGPWHATGTTTISLILVGIAAWEGILHRVYLYEPRVLEQAQASQTKHGMKDIDHIPWPISNAAEIGVLEEEEGTLLSESSDVGERPPDMPE